MRAVGEGEENWKEWVICKHLQKPAKSAFPSGTRRSLVRILPRGITRKGEGPEPQRLTRFQLFELECDVRTPRGRHTGS